MSRFYVKVYRPQDLLLKLGSQVQTSAVLWHFCSPFANTIRKAFFNYFKVIIVIVISIPFVPLC